MTDGWNGWKELEHDDDGGRGGGVANTDDNYDAWHKQEHRAEPAQSDGREEQGQASTVNRRGCGVSGPHSKEDLQKW